MADEKEAERRENAAPDSWIGTDPLGAYFIRRLEEMDRRADAKADAKAPEGDVQITKPRFNWSFDTGHALTLTLMVLGGIGAYGQASSWATRMDGKLETYKVSLDALYAKEEAHETRTSTIEKLATALAGRQDNQGDGLIDLRKVVADLAKAMTEQAKVSAEMHESMAIMKFKLDREDNAKGPKG